MWRRSPTRLAESVVVLDVRGISPITDYFVIFTGQSPTHLRAVGQRVEDALTEVGEKPSHVDGFQGGGWVVIDFGNVIAHAMLAETRKFYDLERLWGDAPQVEWA